MRIPSANIPAKVGSHLPTTLPIAAPAAGQRRMQAAADTYSKNTQAATAQVIDAEYVEFYSPSNAVLNQELNNLDYTLEPALDAETDKTGSSLPKSLEKYQQGAQRAPEPTGLLLNIYA